MLRNFGKKVVFLKIFFYETESRSDSMRSRSRLMSFICSGLIVSLSLSVSVHATLGT